MLRPIPNNAVYSRISINRMRYRGPIESYKMNKFKADVYKDLSILKGKFDLTCDRLSQYIHDVVDEINNPIVIKQDNEVIYDGKEKENVAILNHSISLSLRED